MDEAAIIKFQEERILSERPTLMALPNTPLPPLQIGMTRYLMGQGGLYIESAPAWGHIIAPLWTHRAPLPYAPVQPGLVIHGGLIPKSIIKQILDDAIEAAPLEYAGAIYYSPQNGYRYTRSIAKQTYISKINYELIPREEDESLILDVHSHGHGRSFFSDTDDADDRGGIRICLVVGNCTDYAKINYSMRLNIEGHYIPIHELGLIMETKASS